MRVTSLSHALLITWFLLQQPEASPMELRLPKTASPSSKLFSVPAWPRSPLRRVLAETQLEWLAGGGESAHPGDECPGGDEPGPDGGVRVERGSARGKCVEPGCSKVALFGLVHGEPRTCTAHHAPSERNVVHRICASQGCTRRAGFGASVAEGPARCAAHRLPADRDVVNRICLHPEGCTRRATFGASPLRRPGVCRPGAALTPQLLRRSGARGAPGGSLRRAPRAGDG